MMGYQLAIESMSEFPPSIKESAFWLNSVLSTVWRVGSGGLEPRISSSIRESLAETLSRPYSKPSAVAHVALNAFTFGSSPPIISRIELTGVDRDESVIFFNVDIGILLRDSVLLLGEWSGMTNVYVCEQMVPSMFCFFSLDIKPSTLEYRSIPSTKVSINTLDAKATLDISIKCSPDYPYISFINISLVEIPAFSLRIEPQGER
jgi:Ca2+-dependent lipid-binding protein